MFSELYFGDMMDLGHKSSKGFFFGDPMFSLPLKNKSRFFDMFH